MLAFAAALTDCNEVLPIDIDTHGINMTTYVLGSGGKPSSVVIVNKDSLQDTHLSIKELGINTGIALRLIAPSGKSKTGITFGNAAVDPDGRWREGAKEEIRDGAVAIPRMSAIVLRSTDLK
jgi:hypothetical protein